MSKKDIAIAKRISSYGYASNVSMKRNRTNRVAQPCQIVKIDLWAIEKINLEQ